MSKPSTALLIPCYNAERYLENLRRQVDALDPKFDELVIVDDGSTDGTVANARSLGFDIIPLGVNRGPGAARNAAARRATAEWIHFLDADDEIVPEYLAKVLPLAGDGVGVVLSATDLVDEVSRELLMRWDYPDQEFRANALRAAILHPVLLHSSLICRSVFEKSGGFDEEHRCWEDGDVHVRLASVGARFRVTHDVLACSPRHKRGTSGDDIYCHRCRLAFLRKYVTYVPRMPAADLAEQASRCAVWLSRDGDHASSEAALDLAYELGWRGPDSRHLLISCLARIPSKRLKKLLFNWQMCGRSQK